jgi:hypothetical protein
MSERSGRVTPKELYDLEAKIYGIWKAFDGVSGEDVPHIRTGLVNTIERMVRMRRKLEAEVSA